MNTISSRLLPWGKRIKQSPIPFGALLLLVLSLSFWLTGRLTLANWTLLAITFPWWPPIALGNYPAVSPQRGQR